jgi:hypothetical protein
LGLPVAFRAEDSPRGLWRSLGKRVGLTALAGSNPASSASPKPEPDLRKRGLDLGCRVDVQISARFEAGSSALTRGIVGLPASLTRMEPDAADLAQPVGEL